MTVSHLCCRYVLKSQMKALLEEEAKNARTIEEEIEDERRKVDAKTPITESVSVVKSCALLVIVKAPPNLVPSKQNMHVVTQSCVRQAACIQLLGVATGEKEIDQGSCICLGAPHVWVVHGTYVHLQHSAVSWK